LTHIITLAKRASLLSRTLVILMFINMQKPNTMLFLNQEKDGRHGDTCGWFLLAKFFSDALPMLSLSSFASHRDRLRKNKLSSGRWLPAGKNKTEPTTT
jgi:hypothetical protein